MQIIPVEQWILCKCNNIKNKETNTRIIANNVNWKEQ